MPIIPLPTRSNALPNAPGPVLDHERRPTVDNSKVITGVANLANAGKMPELPMELAANPGMAAIGKAVQQTGNLVGALAIKRQEAETDIQVANADNAMQAERSKFEQWKIDSNAEPSTWAAEWGKRFGAAQTQILNNDQLHPEARDQITLRLNRYGGQSLSDVEMGATKETFARAKSAFVASIDSATEAQDSGRFESALATASERGYLYASEIENAKERFVKVGEQKKKQAEADADRVKLEAAVSNAIADPLKWKEENKTPWKGDEITWQKAKNAADARELEGSHEAVDQLTDAIISGDLTLPTEIDAWESPFLTPALKEQAKHYLASRNDFTEKQDREENGVKNAVELRHAIANLDPEKDADRKQLFALTSEIATRVPEELRGDLRTALASRYSTKEAPEIKDQISKTINVYFDPKDGAIPYRKKEFTTVKHASDEGRWFGQDRYKKGDPVIDPETGKPRIVTDKTGNERFTWVTDRDAEFRAIQAETVVRKKMEEWRRANPDKANDPKAVQKALLDVLPEGTRAGALELLQKKMTQPKSAALGHVTSYGYANDSTPDSNSSAGIGAFVPDSEEQKIKRGEPSDYRLRDGDIAVSPDVEKAFRASGVKPGGSVMVQLANGEVRQVRWMDRTAQDEDVLAGKIKGVSKPLRGRFDFYSPSGKHSNDGMAVVNWWKPGQEVASR